VEESGDPTNYTPKVSEDRLWQQLENNVQIVPVFKDVPDRKMLEDQICSIETKDESSEGMF